MGGCFPDAAILDICGVGVRLAVRFVDLELLSMWIVKGDAGEVSGLGLVNTGIEGL